MMKINFTKHAVCRTPAFPLEATLETHWRKLKEMIAGSSPDFYSIIAHLEYNDIKQQPLKIQFTIWKYYNRAKYRSTPFGDFAAISLVPVQPTDSYKITIDKQIDMHLWPDWMLSPDLATSKKKYDNNCAFRTNSSGYIHNQEYRYLFKEAGRFVLSAIPLTEEVEKITNFCRETQSYGEIVSLLKTVCSLPAKTGRKFIQSLVDLQVIQHEFQPNITGEDYFSRVGVSPALTNQDSYSIATRSVSRGYLPKQMLKDIGSYLHFIAQSTNIKSSSSLADFKARFVARWEDKLIPLSLALDPILGIGYENDMPFESAEWMSSLRQSKPKQHQYLLTQESLEQFILNNLLKGGDIHLEGFDKPCAGNSLLPNTGTVQLKFYDGKPVIYGAGGATATALLGRFTAIPEVNSYTKSMAELEEKANPDVLFFDLAYTCEGKVDNVNRRQQLYATELVFSGWSTMTEALRMEDILIGIRENEVILFHQLSGKRLIPRLASAYNYTRSDLAHFRFLCDLHLQGLQTDLQIDLRNMFPGLEKYPRVYYKNCIVNPARWRLPDLNTPESLKQWLEKQNIDEFFLIGNGDQTLLINPLSDDDLQFLLMYRKNHPFDYITEALLQKETGTTDETGENYYATFMVDFYHQNMCFKGYTFHLENHSNSQDLFLPGSEWLYLELYMHPMVMDDFLKKEMKLFIRKQQGKLKKWFFIRYNNPEYHVRLRLKMKSVKYLSSIMEEMQKLFEPIRKDGRLRKILIKEYEPEWLRYGIQRMKLIEQFFGEDSKEALSQLNLSVQQKMESVLGFIATLGDNAYPDLSSQSDYFKRMANRFSSEIMFDTVSFKAINKHYSDYKIEKRIVSKKTLTLFDKIIKCCAEEEKMSMLADIVHMHINRRFGIDPRLHEAVIYQFLYKWRVSQISRTDAYGSIPG